MGGLSSRKVSLTMIKLGYKQVHTRDGNFFKVYEVPLDQIQSQIASEVIGEGCEETNHDTVIF